MTQPEPFDWPDKKRAIVVAAVAAVLFFLAVGAGVTLARSAGASGWLGDLWARAGLLAFWRSRKPPAAPARSPRAARQDTGAPSGPRADEADDEDPESDEEFLHAYDTAGRRDGREGEARRAAAGGARQRSAGLSGRAVSYVLRP